MQKLPGLATLVEGSRAGRHWCHCGNLAADVTVCGRLALHPELEGPERSAIISGQQHFFVLS